MGNTQDLIVVPGLSAAQWFGTPGNLIARWWDVISCALNPPGTGHPCSFLHFVLSCSHTVEADFMYGISELHGRSESCSHVQ